MSKNIKMIGLDLDGTLLTREKKLTEYTKAVLRKAIEQGVVVLVATGRPFSAIAGGTSDISGNAICGDGKWCKNCGYCRE